MEKVILPRCSSCRHWNTDMETFKTGDNIGWGYCTNRGVWIPGHKIEWNTASRVCPEKNACVNSEYKGWLTEENTKNKVFGVCQTGADFGCVHHEEGGATKE